MQRGQLVAAGVATPTECFAALAAGAQTLKVFPAGSFGPDYIRAIRAVLPAHTPVMAVGGVTPENLHIYLRAGCIGAGLGSDLYKAWPDPGTHYHPGARVYCCLSGSSSMKITRISTYRVPPRWMFLKIETDEGIVGWGEPVLEGRAKTVEAAVHEMSEYLIGQDPARINDLWQVLLPRRVLSRRWHFDEAPLPVSIKPCGDIKGKALGVPVYQLLGGLVRDRMKTYSWVGGDRPADIIKDIKARVELGFDTFKMNGCEELAVIDSSRAIDAAVNKVAEIREAFGNQIEFGLDFHGRVTAPMARVLIKELEPYRPLFIEEPVLAEQAEYYPKAGCADAYFRWRQASACFSRFEFKNVLAAGGISILQPDLSHAGGITECLKIAGMAEAYDVALAPHCPLGPIALAACFAS